jgi:antitoxin component YwqK of YwqJK toxin-antitoxin module
MKLILALTTLFFSIKNLNAQFKETIGDLKASLDIPVKPIKENGKSKIYYELLNYKFIPNTQIIDWHSSLRKIENKEAFNPKSTYLIENAKYENGKKNGEFTLTLCQLNVNAAQTGYYLSDVLDVAKGNYINDQYDGTITIYSLIDMKEKTGYINLEFLKGQIKDQTLKYPEVLTRQVGKTSFSFTPTIVFKNGKVSEIFSCDVYPYYKKYVESLVYTSQYNGKPLCFNQFSFISQVNQQYINSKSLIDLNVNNLALEVFMSEINNAGEEQINGSYRLFKANSAFFDTSTLISNFNYLDGKRNGEAIIWDISKNGKNGDSSLIKLNYKNDLLDGTCYLYYPDGKLAVSAIFDKGFPIGEAISYYNPPNNKVFLLKTVIPRWVDNGGILMINQIGDWSDVDQEAINTIREKGGRISDLSGYGKFSSVNYELDSMKTNGKWFKGSVASNDVSWFNNGKLMVTLYINKEKPTEYTDIKYYDETGKEVYSLIKAKEDLKKDYAEKANEKTSCIWCQKEFRFGDRFILDDCTCFSKEDGSEHSVILWSSKFFCSRDCRMKYEQEQCRKNGYSYN